MKQKNTHPRTPQQTAVWVAKHINASAGRHAAGKTGRGGPGVGMGKGGQRGHPGDKNVTDNGQQSHLDPVRYGLRSCLRRRGVGLGQLWPDFLPIIRAKFAPGHDRPTQNLYCWAFFNRHTSDLPISDGGQRHIKTLSKKHPAADHAGHGVNRVFPYYFHDLYFLHAAMLTRIVLVDQHHVLTLFVLNQPT